MADNFFKINKGVSLGHLPTAPSNPVNGDFYYNTADEKFYFYENSFWRELGASTVTPQTYTYSTPGGGTFICPAGAKYMTVEVQGAGGGGARGSMNYAGTNFPGSAGQNGQASVFSGTLPVAFTIQANGGQGGPLGLTRGTNGANASSISSPLSYLRVVEGGLGNGPLHYHNYASYQSLASAGASAKDSELGNGGAGGSPGTGNGSPTFGEAGVFGAGGGGGATGGSQFGGETRNLLGGAAGCAGAYIKVLVPDPSGNYSYFIGTGGAGATAGANANLTGPGGQGGHGLIIVTVYF